MLQKEIRTTRITGVLILFVANIILYTVFNVSGLVLTSENKFLIFQLDRTVGLLKKGGVTPD